MYIISKLNIQQHIIGYTLQDKIHIKINNIQRKIIDSFKPVLLK